MRLLRLVPDGTRIRFMRGRSAAFLLTLLMTVASLASLWFAGLNLGLDFVGGILVEARSAGPLQTGPSQMGSLRASLAGLELGEVSLQVFGGGQDLLIRVQEQPGGGAAQERAIAAIKSLLEPGFEIRRTEFIGPQVTRELLRNGILAALLAVLLISLYVWVRFEWQFGLAAMITTFHDVIATFGLFSLFQLEFNLTIVAALLTIAGYSVNDTVVLFDRVRENLRRYRTMPMESLIDLSVNQTLARTVMTSGTTLLAVLALLLFGGPVLRNFSVALTWGLIVGTYSSVFVASALLLHMPSVRTGEEHREQDRRPHAQPPVQPPVQPPGTAA